MVDWDIPRYKCHKEVKEVNALKIKSIKTYVGKDGATSTEITPEGEGFGPFSVKAEYVRKHNPQTGGYYVFYESFSMAETFKKAHTLI